MNRNLLPVSVIGAGLLDLGTTSPRLFCILSGKPTTTSQAQYGHAGTVVITIGPSNANTKTASVPAGYTCPSIVPKANWVGHFSFNDTFKITQSGTGLSVKRTNSDGGWGMNLSVMCTSRGASCVHTPAQFLHMRASPNHGLNVCSCRAS